MKKFPPTPYTVYYDGDCIVCDTEIRHYRRLVQADRLRFVDIAAETFHPPRSGPTKKDFEAQMHLQDGNGGWHRGVDAFSLMWHTLPGQHWHWMSRWVQLPLLRPLARLLYRVFARNRHRLPRRKKTCPDHHCDLKDLL